MAIRDIVLRGFGNGTFSGSIALIVTRGFSIGEEVAAVTGGYTPYSVYDPGQERRIRARRKALRRERERLRDEIQALVEGRPREAPQAPIEAKPAKAPVKAPVVVSKAPQRPSEDVAAIEARRARLEIIANELAVLLVDLKAFRARAAEDRRIARENELLAILLLAS